MQVFLRAFKCYLNIYLILRTRKQRKKEQEFRHKFAAVTSKLALQPLLFTRETLAISSHLVKAFILAIKLKALIIGIIFKFNRSGYSTRSAQCFILRLFQPKQSRTLC
jgi:hypothetical protein